jgi:hypothetical protein
MVGNDWLGGWGGGGMDQGGDGLPANRKAVVVVCCPKCSSFNVGRRDWCEGDIMAFWECRGCAERWKEPMKVGQAKIRAAIP